MKDGSYERHAHTRFYIRARTVRCDKDGDVAPLREVECYLSYDIGSDADRYDPREVGVGEESLNVGDTVLARLPVPEGGSSDGGQYTYVHDCHHQVVW